MQHYDIMPLTLVPGRQHGILLCSKKVVLMFLSSKNALKSDFWMKNAFCPVEQFLEMCWCNICQSLDSVTEIFKITLQVSKSTLQERPRPVHYH